MKGKQRFMPRKAGDYAISSFFEPRNVAIVGSFREGYFGGYVIVKSLLNAGYGGAIYPVNPGYREVHGIRVYSSLSEVPDRVDLVMIMVNAKTVSRILKECGEKGIRAAIVVSDGFAERDETGARLQKEIAALAKKVGLRIMGPNTAGVVNAANGFNPCPYEAGYYRLPEGGTAICAQTGMINPQAVPYPDLHFGVSKICDLGNKCDVDEADMLEYLAGDGKTKVISMYLEGIHDGPRFLKLAKRATIRKPLLVLKSGRTEQGAEASQSHTGSLAMDDQIFNAACLQSGVLRLERFGDIFEMPKIFAAQGLPGGNRVGMVTVTGGVAVIAIDECARNGLSVAKLGGGTAGELEKLFVGLGKNPVDVGPMMAAVPNAFDLYPRILGSLLGDQNVDALFAVLWANPSGNIIGRYIETFEGLKARFRKPVATWIYGPDRGAVYELRDRLERAGFPVFDTPEKCIRALGLLCRYAALNRRG